MKYINANCVLPEEIIELIQKYVQGECIYIPVKSKFSMETVTDYKNEIEKRDAHIYDKHLEGVGNKWLAKLYHLSESSIRRIIIKQKKGYEQMNDKINKILYHWGLQNRKIKQIYHTAWQVGDDYVLKLYHNKEMLERNLKILRVLDEMRIPVGQIVPTYENAQYVSSDDIFYFLSKRLSGSRIIQIENVRNLAFMMGGIISDLHLAFKKCEDMDEFWNNSLLDEMNGWVKNNFKNTNWKYLGRDEYEKVTAQLADIYDSLPEQLIHRDVHFGNFLFADGKFSGYIDFDLSQRNIRVFDLCYFLLGLLSEEEKYNLTEEQWFEFVKYTFDGYESKMKLSEIEKEAIPHVMKCIELLFISYFEGIKDSICVQNAYKIYLFVQKHEDRIRKEIQ